MTIYSQRQIIFVLVPRYPIAPQLFSDGIQIAQNLLLFLLPCLNPVSEAIEKQWNPAVL